MLRHLRDPGAIRETMLSLLETAGTLAGIAVGLVGFLNGDRADATITIADDMLAISALGFLVVCYLVFFVMRDTVHATGDRMLMLIDVLFLASMTLMVLAGIVVLYTLM